MSRLGRFLRLERARPAPDAEPAPGASLRFEAIEPRRGDPATPPPDDPFAPPRQREVRLELADDVPEADRAKEERRARAEAELAELARERDAQRALDRTSPAPPWLQRREALALARMTTTGRIIVLGTAALVIGVLAQLTGPIAWGLFPIIAAVVIGSHFLHAT